MYHQLINFKYVYIGGTGGVLTWFAANVGAISTLLVAITTITTLIWKFVIDLKNAKLEATLWEMKKKMYEEKILENTNEKDS